MNLPNSFLKIYLHYVPESAVKYTDGLINKWKSYSEVDSGRDVQMAEEMNKFVKKDVCTPLKRSKD